ncbi:MAG: exosortase/archaeosortase family protein [Verrucomicrobiota bacterium]
MDDRDTVGVLDQFQTEFVEFWQRLPNKGFFFALLACWLVLFHFFGNATLGYVDTPSLFRWMLNSYLARDPDGHLQDDSIGLWVPLLVLGLIWWKQKELLERPPKLWSPGLVLVIAGLLLHMAGYFIQQPRLSIIALLTGIYGLMGMAWGWEWMKRIFFPFFLMGFLIPFSTLIEPVTFPLRLVASQITEGISQTILSIDINREGTMLKDPMNKYHYEVAAACSGIRSLMAVGLMATVWAFLFFKQWWRRGVMFAAIIPLAVAGNVLRLLTIIVAADNWGQAAGNYVHDGGPGGLFSLLPYVPAIFGLMYLGQYLEEKKPQPAAPKPA